MEEEGGLEPRCQCWGCSLGFSWPSLGAQSLCSSQSGQTNCWLHRGSQEQWLLVESYGHLGEQLLPPGVGDRPAAVWCAPCLTVRELVVCWSAAGERLERSQTKAGLDCNCSERACSFFNGLRCPALFLSNLKEVTYIVCIFKAQPVGYVYFPSWFLSCDAIVWLLLHVPCTPRH